VVVLCDRFSAIANIAWLVMIEACVHTSVVVYGVREPMAYSSVESSSVAHGAERALNELCVQSSAPTSDAVQISLAQLEVVDGLEQSSGGQVPSADALAQSASIPRNPDRVEALPNSGP
jgi:hypothetical protein